MKVGLGVGGRWVGLWSVVWGEEDWKVGVGGEKGC